MKHHRITPHPPSGVPGRYIPVSDTHREIAELYKGIFVQLASRWRIVVCKDGTQWIVQRRSSKHLNKGMWIGRSYCTTRDALIRVCSELGLLSGPKARAVLDALPARISDYRK